MDNIISHRSSLTLLALFLALFFVPVFSHAVNLEDNAGLMKPPSGSVSTPLNKKNNGIITGKIIVKEGGSMAGGKVSFYNAETGPPPSPRKFNRVPDMVVDIGTDSRFTAEVPAGTYYLLAFKRSATGPADDYRFRDRDEKGTPKTHVVKENETTDIGVLVVDLARQKEQRKKLAEVQTTSLEGIITDQDGNPLENERVYAFLSSQKGTRPVFASSKSDKDGRYVLRIAEGSYYLRVKNDLESGVPSKGQFVDSYGAKDPVLVTVKDGEKKTGIDMKVERFPGKGPFPGQGPKYGKGPKQDTVGKPIFIKPPFKGIFSPLKPEPNKDVVPEDTAPREDMTPKLKSPSPGTAPK